MQRAPRVLRADAPRGRCSRLAPRRPFAQQPEHVDEADPETTGVASLRQRGALSRGRVGRSIRRGEQRCKNLERPSIAELAEAFRLSRPRNRRTVQ
jgi:hypothetical protein